MKNKQNTTAAGLKLLPVILQDQFKTAARARARVAKTKGDGARATWSRAVAIEDARGASIAPHGMARGGARAVSAEDLRASRAGLLSACDAVTLGEQARAMRAGLLSAEDAAWYVEQERAAAAGLLTGAEVEAMREASAASAVELAKQERRALTAAADGALVELAQALAVNRAKRFADLRARGLWQSGAVSMAPLGAGKGSKRRAAIEAAEREAARGLGRLGEWHEVQAVDAGKRLVELRAVETRAAAARLLADGLHGKACARALRMATAGARRWMRRKSKSEAMERAEVGGAAGVNERQAWESWLAEVEGVYRLHYLRAAAWGCWLTQHAVTLPAPCAALVTRGLTGGTAEDPRRGFLARGKRADGAPVVEWTDKGRQVAAESLVIHGRGAAWVHAANGAARASNSLRYGARGRDGREVAAGWSINGSVALCYVSQDEAGELVEASRPAWGPVSGRPDQSAGVARRVGVAEAIHGVLQDAVTAAGAKLRAARVEAARMRARADWLLARAAVAQAAGRKRRAAVARKVAHARQAAAGSMIGGAVRGFRAASEDALHLGGAMRGAALPPEVFAGWIRDHGALTPAGWKKADRMRDAVRDKLPFPYVATVNGRAAAPAAPAVMGDEVASGPRAAFAFTSAAAWQSWVAMHAAGLPKGCQSIAARALAAARPVTQSAAPRRKRAVAC